MAVYVRPVDRGDRMDAALYEMVQECPAEENGFLNRAAGLSPAGFSAWVLRQVAIGRGENLSPGWVRQTLYWLYDGDRPVGSAKLRHALTPALRVEGGHIGYGVRPSARGQGYGRTLLALMLAEAGRQGIEPVLVTINNDNLLSLRVAWANGGRLEKRTARRSYFWFSPPRPHGDPSGALPL